MKITFLFLLSFSQGLCNKSISLFVNFNLGERNGVLFCLNSFVVLIGMCILEHGVIT